METIKCNSAEEMTLRVKLDVMKFIHKEITDNSASVHGAICIVNHGKDYSMVQLGNEYVIGEMSRAVARESYKAVGPRALLVKPAWPVHALVFSLGMLAGIYLGG